MEGAAKVKAVPLTGRGNSEDLAVWGELIMEEDARTHPP